MFWSQYPSLASVWLDKFTHTLITLIQNVFIIKEAGTCVIPLHQYLLSMGTHMPSEDWGWVVQNIIITNFLFNKQNHSWSKWEASYKILSLDQGWSISNFPCSLTRNITSHSIQNLAFHRWQIITVTSTFLFKSLGECMFWTSEWQLIPNVIEMDCIISWQKWGAMDPTPLNPPLVPKPLR